MSGRVNMIGIGPPVDLADLLDHTVGLWGHWLHLSGWPTIPVEVGG
jgi:hypothetical protein